MVKRVVNLLALFAIMTALGARARELPAYALGDAASGDVITTTLLHVVDPTATAEIRDKEARKIHLQVVYGTNHANVIEQEVRLAVTRMREEFLALLQANYGNHRLPPGVVQSRQFKEMVNQFLATQPEPPVPRSSLALWAEGQNDEGFLDGWFAPLRQVMDVPICPDQLPEGRPVPADMKLSLTPVDDLQLFVKADLALSSSVPGQGADLVLVSAAREKLHETMSMQSTAIARFMANELEPNCRFDTNLTQRVKDFAVAGLLQIKQFEPGELVVRKGQVIDATALAALTEMRQHAKMADLEQQVAVDRVAVKLLSERNLWLAGLLGITVLVLVIVIVRSHRRQRQELTPVLSSTLLHAGVQEEGVAQATVVEAPPPRDEQWRHRALEAEREAEQAKTLARSNLMPHLAQQLKDNVVQQLAAQMDGLLDVQAAVAEQMATLEERLERMHAPLQERLRTYEQRIGELEQDLSNRGDENQVLLRARIDALRRQMDKEKAETNTN